MSIQLKTDYLIIGSGAMGMAFTDTLLTETDANIILVDRFAKPGGHWNSAYPFVTLHQPSSFYGVNSKELSQGRIDKSGWNKNLAELATLSEIMAYYEDVMYQRLLPSGRVTYFPLCEYENPHHGTSKPQAPFGHFRHKLSGKSYTVDYKKIVNCTYLNTTVPSTHTPKFDIDEPVRFIPPNDLPLIEDKPDGYVIIGGGKTGIDSCLRLLEQGVNPDDISWIISRDGWMLDRQNTQTDIAFFADTIGAQANQFEAIAGAKTPEEMFDRLESCGYFLRLDKKHQPSMFHGATISRLELEQLQRLKNVIRLGHVTSISQDDIILNHGRMPTTANTVHIDCSASAIKNYAGDIPIFNGAIITPQTVRSYQPVFSAAFIAHIEASYETDTEKNAYCKIVPLPDTLTDYIRLTLAFMMNQQLWSRTPEIRDWLQSARLDGFSKLVANIDKDDTDKQVILSKLRTQAVPAALKLSQFLSAQENL